MDLIPVQFRTTSGKVPHADFDLTKMMSLFGSIPATLTPDAVLRAELAALCLGALGDMVSDGTIVLQDRFLAARAVKAVRRIFSAIPSTSWHYLSRMEVLQKHTWAITGLYRSQPAPPLADVACAFDYFAQVLVGSDGEEMFSDAPWVTCYLLEASEMVGVAAERGKRFLDAGFTANEAVPTPHPVLKKIIRHAKRTGDHVLPGPALRLLGAVMACPATTSRMQLSPLVW